VTRADWLAAVGHLFNGKVHVNLQLPFVDGMEFDKDHLYTLTAYTE